MAMKKRDLRNSSRGAVAAGAAAAGIVSFGTIFLGAAALGAVAVGALAVGRLSVRHTKLRRVEIDNLTVGRLNIGGDRRSVSVRVRAQPGKGEALQRLIAGEVGAIASNATLLAHRSEVDPELFMLQASWSVADRDTPYERPLVLDALIREAAANGLIATSSAEPVALEVFRSI